MKVLHELKNLQVEEISLVPEGANQAAHVLLTKSKPKHSMNEGEKVNDEILKQKEAEVEVLKEQLKAQAEVLAVVEKAKAETEQLRAENVAKENRIAALEKSAKREAVRKQVVETGAAVDIEKAVDTLLSVDALGSEMIFTMLKQLAAAQVPLLKTHGGSGVEVNEHANILNKVDLLVVKQRKETPELSVAQAEAKVWRDNPDLYAEYMNSLN